jgi:hypothetical protein
MTAFPYNYTSRRPDILRCPLWQAPRDNLGTDETTEDKLTV